MRKQPIARAVFLLALAALSPGAAFCGSAVHGEPAAPVVSSIDVAALWRGAANVASRELFYGCGGEAHQPHGTFTFVKEDLDGTNPKFVVRDDDGVEWRVKLGAEARPETVASRLVWAAGYYANEDYFLSVIRVAHLPRLKRGANLVQADGSLCDVVLKRYLDGEKKIANWRWRDNPFCGTRELNGLRVLMALINNWDLTDENNAIYRETRSAPPAIYMVSDVGSTFGASALTWPLSKARGNLSSYRHSIFIRKVTPGHVDFGAPHRDSLFFLFTPREFSQKLHLEWIGRHVPREDARWMGQILAGLSPDQVRDAFRAAGYSPVEVAGFATAVLARIDQLKRL